MSLLRKIAMILLGAILAVSLAADFLAPAPYQVQFRDAPSAPPSRHFPLGTDELGRDRLSRLLYGSRVSLLLAPAAALLATGLAALAGGAAGLLGGRWERILAAAMDLSLSLPWLFALITVRAMLPLDLPPLASVTITFLMLGVLGWAAPARVVRAAVVSIRSSQFLLQARAAGCTGFRLWRIHVLPHLQPVLTAQFLVSVPVFILSEANLGLLGLGVAEPMPSWGNLLRDLENVLEVRANPWMLAPAGLLVLATTCLQLVVPRKEVVA